jgi:hypothetical protein
VGQKMTALDSWDVFHAACAALVVIVFLSAWKRFIRRPIVWVLDDSEIDLMLFGMNIRLDGCYVRYFTDHESIINAHIKSLATGSKPACVVVDYYLSSKVQGDEVLKYFREQGVESVIITGYEGKISGIAERDVIHKSPEPEYYKAVSDRVYKMVGLA